MTRLTREDFHGRLLRCVERAIDLIQDDVAEPLPHFYRFELAGFGRAGMESWLDDVLAYLYRDGMFPCAVDVAVSSVMGDATLLWLRPSGHPFVSSVEETLFPEWETAPFKEAAFVWDRPRPLTLRDLEAAAPIWAYGIEQEGETLRQVLGREPDEAKEDTPGLRRFWIIFAGTEAWHDQEPGLPRPGRLGRFGIADAFSCGVTAWDIEDALTLVQERIYGDVSPPVLAIIHDIDRAVPTVERGVWYPPLNQDAR
jgi:hypothetical protein